MSILSDYDSTPDARKAIFMLGAIKNAPDPVYAELRASRPILVAPPGMGKTSTLLQVAVGLVAHGETPVFVSLADWATENKRPIERESEPHFF